MRCQLTLCLSLHLDALHFLPALVRLEETLAKQRLSEEIRKKESIEEEMKAEEEIARLRNEAESEISMAAINAVHARRILNDTTKASSVLISDNDDVSDIDDVPEAILSDETTVTSQERMKAFVRGIDLMTFFQSSQYRTISFVFGPVMCFWIIA